MNREYQLTFFVEDTSATSFVAQPLCKLARQFKSQLQIINITQNSQADLSNSLAMLQVALKKGDLVQITATGIDAELACFVLKDLVVEHYVLVGSQITHEFSPELTQRFPQISPRCETRWLHAKAQMPLTKFECLKGLAKLVYPDDPDQLLLSFIKREERSSTSVAHGVALPHVMFEHVDDVSVAVITTDNEIDWGSRMGPVTVAIALVLPVAPSREQIIASTTLTRNLLNDNVLLRLQKTRSSIDLQALLMYLTLRLI
ncbi:PTS sugar transporter subunit IIA [Vibrio maerlii]|uniref:PTS sugar transporter subunit IIA n=1 Tax=Vibrio maerlii TaxID=2231648 RepID=UPI000E3C74D7|nr:PTS sugar transporter subunit IIA [Vibrio maerlii]